MVQAAASCSGFANISIAAGVGKENTTTLPKNGVEKLFGIHCACVCGTLLESCNPFFDKVSTNNSW